MLIWKDGVYDTDKREWLRVDKVRRGVLFTDPAVWGLLSYGGSEHEVSPFGVNYDGTAHRLVQHISSISYHSNDNYENDLSRLENMLPFGEYVQNGVIRVKRSYYTLFDLISRTDVSKGYVYVMHHRCGYVRIEFDDSISRFFTKVMMLNKRE